MKTIRPLEVVYLSHLEIPTDEGSAFAFFAIDDFSKYAFHLGIEKSCGEHPVFKQIVAFTQLEEFQKKHQNFPFTMVIPYDLGDVAVSAVNEVLKHFNGKLEHNPILVINKTNDFVDVFKKGLDRISK